MHPEHSAMISRLVMDERRREAQVRRTHAAVVRRPRPSLRAGLGAVLVRAGTRLSRTGAWLARPRQASPEARRA